MQSGIGLNVLCLPFDASEIRRLKVLRPHVAHGWCLKYTFLGIVTPLVYIPSLLLLCYTEVG